MNEAANQQLRDHETRANACNGRRHFTQWIIPIESHIIGKYSREDITPHVGLPLPSLGSNFEGLFRKVETGVQENCEPDDPTKLPLRKVPDDNRTWWSPTPHSQRNARAEMTHDMHALREQVALG